MAGTTRGVTEDVQLGALDREQLPGGALPQPGYDCLCALVSAAAAASGTGCTGSSPRSPSSPPAAKKARTSCKVDLCAKYALAGGSDDASAFLGGLLRSAADAHVVLPGCGEVVAAGRTAAKLVRAATVLRARDAPSMPLALTACPTVCPVAPSSKTLALLCACATVHGPCAQRARPPR